MSAVVITFKPKSVSKRLLGTLNPRTREVITNRYGLDTKEKKTLEAIGKGYGITRERVRQIENFALATIRKSGEFKNHDHVFEELSQIVKALGAIVPEDVLMKAISQDEVVHNHINFLMTLSPKFNKHKEDDNFNSRFSVDSAIADHVHDVLHKIAKSINKDELVKEEEIVARFLTESVHLADEYKSNKDIIMKYLNLSKVLGKNQLDEWGHTTSSQVRARGIKDYAYLVLRREGKPMHFRDVAAAINKTFKKEAHVATCHNELIKDKRFALVGRGMYGLAEWGHVSGVVKDIVKKIISDNGSPMSKEEIIDRVTKIRDVKANTIFVNLQNPKYFKKTADGKYTNL